MRRCRGQSSTKSSSGSDKFLTRILKRAEARVPGASVHSASTFVGVGCGRHYRNKQMTWEKLLELARAEVTETIAALPEKFRGHASGIPVVYERIPNAALIQDDIEPDTLGLFVGPAFADEASTQAGIPSQIILFLENIWEMVEDDVEEFRIEVRRTFLHELGHYLGLDEDELDARGLL